MRNVTRLKKVYHDNSCLTNVRIKSVLLILSFMLFPMITRADNHPYEEKIDRLIQPLVEHGLLGGVILIAESGKTAFAKGYGYADREKKTKNTPHTRFRISSITKVFTALAVMQLHDRGKLDIRKPVSLFFEDLPNGDKITILHLLTHTSGISSYNWMKSENKPAPLATVYEWIKALPLKFEPGSDFLYSNSGYVLLTMIIEKVSGLSYDNYLRKNIFSSLEMADTGLTLMDRSVDNLAFGYSKSGYGPYQPANRPTPLGRGDGDLYSTASDLLKLVNGFYSNRVVPEKIRKLMTTVHRNGYGIGWFIKEKPDENIVYHPGGSLGNISDLRVYQNGEKILINLFNSDFLLFREVESELENIVLGKPFSPVMEHKKNDRFLDDLKPFLGEYRIDEGATFELFMKNGRLGFREKGYPECEVYVIEKNKIFVLQSNYLITFIKGASGVGFRGMFGLYYAEGSRILP